MAANVGGTACDFVKGVPRALKTGVVHWTVPGLDGYGAQTLGQRGSEFRFQAVKYGSIAAVNTWVTAIEAHQGTVITIENDWGDEHLNMLVVHVGQPIKRVAIGDFAGSPGARGEVIVSGVKLPA
jgi:hypothetical protein